MRLLRRLRAGLPDRDADREIGHRDRPARAFGGHDLRLLRRRLHLQGRDARRRGRAHGALQGRQGQSRPFLRQGPLRLGLCHPQGPHPQADDPREDHRPLARGVAGTRRSTTPRPSSSASRRSTASDAVGGITSSRCTNEETFLVQKLVRAGFGNNNVDTCARVCHSPTGYGLKTTFGTSAGTQDFDSVEQADVIVVIGANPTDGHPVFASRMKKRLRQGAKLIVIDPRRIDLVRIAACRGGYHLPLLPGTNVAVIKALAHVIVTEGLVERGLRARALRLERVRGLGGVRRRADATARRRSRRSPAFRPKTIRGAARLYATGGNGAIYYGLGVTEHSQGSTMVMAMANLAMATGNIGRPGVGVNPLRGQNNVQGACDMGSFPHEFSGYRHVSDDADARDVRGAVGRHARQRAGPAHPQHARRRGRRHVQGPLRPGRGHRAVRPQHQACRRGARGDGMRRRPGPVPQRDRELRPRLPARLDLPGEGRHLHQRRAPHPAACAR